MDSQSVRGADTVGRESRGYDGGQQANGRKRSAGQRPHGKTATAPTTLLGVNLSTPIRYVFADQGFGGRLVDWAARTLRMVIDIVRKPDGSAVFTSIPSDGCGKDPRVADHSPPPGPGLRA
jgi:hypothetical protein